MSSKKRIEEITMSEESMINPMSDDELSGKSAPTPKTKPGEGLLRQLAKREARLEAEMVAVQEKKQQARDKVTGKTKARAYVMRWLLALTNEELIQEGEKQGLSGDYPYEKIRELLIACMFGEYEVEDAEYGCLDYAMLEHQDNGYPGE